MKEWPVQLWAALIAATGTIAGIIGKRSNTRADAASVLTDGALKVVQELEEEVTRLRKDRDYDRERMRHIEAAQRAEREWCDMRTNQLVTAMRAEGIDVPPPAPRPRI